MAGLENSLNSPLPFSVRIDGLVEAGQVEELHRRISRLLMEVANMSVRHNVVVNFNQATGNSLNHTERTSGNIKFRQIDLPQEELSGSLVLMGTLIKQTRLERDYSQAKLAQEVDASQSYISSIERAAGRMAAPMPKTIWDIGAALGLDPVELVKMAGYEVEKSDVNQE